MAKWEWTQRDSTGRGRSGPTRHMASPPAPTDTPPTGAPTAVPDGATPPSGAIVMTATETALPSLTPSASPAPTGTATGTPTATPTATATSTPSPTPTAPATATPVVATPTAVVCYPPAGWVIHVVQRGETLAILARSRGTSIDRIMAANCLTSSLILPGSGSTCRPRRLLFHPRPCPPPRRRQRSRRRRPARRSQRPHRPHSRRQQNHRRRRQQRRQSLQKRRRRCPERAGGRALRTPFELTLA
jgi:hypothetical protein